METIVFWIMVGMFFMLGEIIVERVIDGEAWSEW